MKSEKCPVCKKKISLFDDECPHCGELIFHEPIVSTYKEEPEDVIEEEVLVHKKKRVNILKKCSKLEGKFKFFKNIRRKYENVIKKFKKSKIYTFITYQNVLACITAICTVAMVCMGVKVVKYSDSNATVKKVNSQTTSEEVEKLEEATVKKYLDVKRSMLILKYEDKEYAGIKTTLYYEINMYSKKLCQTIIKFPYSKKNIASMKKYLEVNYGYGKVQKDGTIIYVDDETRYTFTNGVNNDEDKAYSETVEIIPLN